MEEQRQREQAIVSALAEEIPAMLRGERIEEPVYAVILVYSVDPQEGLLPWIAVGTQREREAFLQDAEEPDLLMWDGEALECYNPIEGLEEDAAFLDLCAQWKEQAIREGNWEGKITAMMQRACFALKKFPWKEVFPLTEDFVVTACTADGDWLQENLSVLLSQKEFDALVQKGCLLPSCTGCSSADME